jgi:predicted metalloprotease with PDZ domain
MNSLPFPLPLADDIPEPEDVEYQDTIHLFVDVTDLERRIFTVRETIPVDGSGMLTLLYPKWLPGYHSPQAPIELLAGLRISARGKDVPWRRHETEVNVFHVQIPYSATEIEAEFQFLSPTSNSQGRVIVSPDLLFVHWNAVVLYPAGHFARRITFEPCLRLPEGWDWGCALEVASRDRDIINFAPVRLDDLVDSPLLAGRHFKRIDLEPLGEVRINMAGDSPKAISPTDDQLAPHRELVRQCDLLFGARHFDRYDVLLALTDDLPSNGVEHHKSCEAITISSYFSEWDKTFVRRDTIPHEYVHSWNGKYRRGADSWTPCFHHPIRNSLMWVYEGQTQYWDRVLCARSGLWSKEIARQALAEIAATHHVRSGSRWRPMSDTTRDPIIAERSPLPWPSWQRSEDYYTEGALVWLDIDTRIRELTDESRSLDDFAREFFGDDDGVWVTNTYTFDDVVLALNNLAPFEWHDFLCDKLHNTTAGAPLCGLQRGGYKLVYRDVQSEYQAGKEVVFGSTNLLFSIGLIVSSGGEIIEVLWESPAFAVGLTAGSQILEVNSEPYCASRIKNAVAKPGSFELRVATGKHQRAVTIESCGNRYPHLEAIGGARLRLDEILEPR